MASGLLDKANIILTPTGYKAGTMYNVAPIEQPYEDFVFSRASVASRVNSSGLVEMVGRTLGSNLVQNGDFSDIGPDLVQNGDFSELGSELVTNGDFATDSDWDRLNATISGGKGNLDGDGQTSMLWQDILTNGNSYKATFTVSDYNGLGEARIINNSGGAIYTITSDGTFTIYFTHNLASGNFLIRARSGAVFSVDNVSVKQVDPNDYWSTTSTVTVKDGFANITSDGSYQYLRQLNIVEVGKSYKLTYEITRQGSGVLKSSSLGLNSIPSTVGTHTVYGLSSQTYIVIDRASACDIDITNIVVQELDPNDYWNLGTGWSIGDNVVMGNGASFDFVTQNISALSGKTIKATFEIKDYISGTFRVSPNDRADGLDIRYSGNGTYETIYTSNVDLFRFQQQAFDGSITNISVKEIIDTNNIPRINYDSNGENGHWLLEPTSTNLLPYSEDFNDASWNFDSQQSYLTRTANAALSPSGNNDATKLISNNITKSPSTAYIASSTSASSPYTASVFAKKGEYDYLVMSVGSYASGFWGSFNLSNGTVDTQPTEANTSASIESYNNGWYRCLITTTTTSGLEICLVSPSVDGGITSLYTSTTNGIYVWGAQLEALPYATSYIPTLTGSTETRATETANGAGSADLINSTEGVLYAEIAALADDSTNRLISLSNADTSQQVWLYFNTSNGLTYRIYNGSTQSTYSHSINIKTFNKIAVKYKANDFGLFVNGTKVYTDTSGSTFTENTLTKLNFDAGDGALDFYGEVKELAVFEALTDDELEKLTSWSSFNAMATDLGYTIE